MGGQTDELRRLVREIGGLRDHSPSLALVQARRAAEALCHAVWQQHSEEMPTGHQSLDRMIAQLDKEGRLPRHISVAMRTVQHFGNIGAHVQEDGGPTMTALEIAPCLQSLANITRWYCDEYEPGEGIQSSDLEHMTGTVERAKLVQRTRRERLSLDLSLETDEDVVDYAHRYERIKRVDILDSSSGNYRSHRWLTITNVTEAPTSFLPHLEAGETKVRFEALKLRAHINDRHGRRLRVTDLTPSQPSFIQKFQMHFPEPLAPAASLSVYYRLSWPSEAFAYSGEEHSQSISFARYWHGVDRLAFGILGNRDADSIRATRITSEYAEVPVPETPVTFVAEDESDLEPIHGRDLRGFRYEFTNVDGLSYRLIYRPSLDNFDEEDDEF